MSRYIRNMEARKNLYSIIRAYKHHSFVKKMVMDRHLGKTTEMEMILHFLQYIVAMNTGLTEKIMVGQAMHELDTFDIQLQ